jgi:CcmD family protein
MKTCVLVAVALLIAVLSLPELLLAQAGLPDPQAIASQNLRGYNHMFIAYFIAWALILGWVISIAKRLGKVEKALKG